MTLRQAMLVIVINAAVTAMLIAIYALWVRPTGAPAFAILDVAELYRLKETQVAALLVKREANDTERETVLRHAAEFGRDMAVLIESLPEECRCLVLARGAIVGPVPQLPDLTPQVRRRLGL